MANKQNESNTNELTSLIFSSICMDDLSFANEVSLKVGFEQGNVLEMGSFNDTILGDIDGKITLREHKLGLSLQRSSSFEEILMENHKHVLIQSIQDYFSKANHQILKKVKKIDVKATPRKDEAVDKKAQIELILQNNYEVGQVVKNQLLDRLSDNMDEIDMIHDMLSLSPKEIKFEVLYLINLLLIECDKIIQHFKKKTFTRQLKEKSINLAKELRKHACLSYLFITDNGSKMDQNFTIMIQKWMITLFLMKVGIFENQLQSKSIEDCLTSEVFKKINMNDLLNQHLIHRINKRKSQKKI